MGKILSIKRISQKIVVTLDLLEDEFKWLEGNLEKMHIFSENNLKYETHLIQRGSNDSSKYILLPKKFKAFVSPSKEIKANFIEKDNEVIMIFQIEKS